MPRYQPPISLILNFSKILAEILLIYNVVLVSSIQQRDSIVCVCVYKKIFFSIIGYYKYSSLLVIFYVYSTVYILTPNSYSS